MRKSITRHYPTTVAVTFPAGATHYTGSLHDKDAHYWKIVYDENGGTYYCWYSHEKDAFMLQERCPDNLRAIPEDGVILDGSR